MHTNLGEISVNSIYKLSAFCSVFVTTIWLFVLLWFSIFIYVWLMIFHSICFRRDEKKKKHMYIMNTVNKWSLYITRWKHLNHSTTDQLLSMLSWTPCLYYSQYFINIHENSELQKANLCCFQTCNNTLKTSENIS